MYCSMKEGRVGGQYLKTRYSSTCILSEYAILLEKFTGGVCRRRFGHRGEVWGFGDGIATEVRCDGVEGRWEVGCGRWDMGGWIRRQVYGDGRVRWLFWVDVWGERKGGFVVGG